MSRHDATAWAHTGPCPEGCTCIHGPRRPRPPARPVYGITVLRHEDGRTEVKQVNEFDVALPVSFEARHELLIAALDQVKREAGVVHTGTEEKATFAPGAGDEDEPAPEVLPRDEEHGIKTPNERIEEEEEV